MKPLFAILSLSLLAGSAFAQPPAGENPLSTWLRDSYKRNHSTILRTAEKMPDEFYGLRPGEQQEVRTFGQQVGHVANFNYLWCSQAKGEKNPNSQNLEKLSTKAEFVKAAQDSFAYCDAVYDALTDASGAETIDITQESGRQARSLRMGLLMLNYAHNNEIYGSMVVYLRMKNIVPPASEPRGGKKK